MWRPELCAKIMEHGKCTDLLGVGASKSITYSGSIAVLLIERAKSKRTELVEWVSSMWDAPLGSELEPELFAIHINDFEKSDCTNAKFAADTEN
eukprot:g24030.t1